MAISIDFSSVPGNDPIPAGNYPVVINEVQVRDSKSSEHQYLNWELEITDGEHAGRKQWFITSLAPKALFRLREVLINLEVYQDQMDFEFDEGTGVMLSPEVVGLPAVAVVKPDTYNGEERSRVDNLLSKDGENLARSKAQASRNNGGPRGTRGKDWKAPGQEEAFLEKDADGGVVGKTQRLERKAELR